MDPLARLFLRYRDRGDAEALGRVFDRLAPRLLALALHLTGRPADAEDLLQQTFVQAMRHRAAFDGARPLEPWLCGLLANLVRNERRREAHRQGVARGGAAPGQDGEGLADDPAAAAGRRELVALLRTRIGTLPEEQRQVLLLQLQHGLAPAEIAEVLGVPPGTVRMRIHRGLAALRRLLPAGLAAWFGALLPARGLGAVRAQVVRAAREGAAGAAGAVSVFGGWLLVKKILLVAPLLLLALFCTWQFLPDPVPPAVAAPGAPPEVARADLGSAAAEMPVENAPTAARQVAPAPPPDTGSLTVTVVAELPAEPGAVASTMPVAGALVRAWPDGEEPLAPGERHWRADLLGQVSFAELPAGLWHVKADAETASSETIAVSIGAGSSAAAEIRWPMQYVVQGIVVDGHGNPVPGAEVLNGLTNFLGSIWPPEAISRIAAVTDAGGRFRFAARDGPMSSVSARKPGYAASGSVAWHRSLAELRLVLGSEGGAVQGTVVGDDGRGYAGAVLTLRAASGTAPGGAGVGPCVPTTTRTGADGSFAFAGVAPGHHRLEACLRGRERVWRDVEVRAFATSEVRILLPGSARVAGRVVHAAGLPISGLQVRTVTTAGTVVDRHLLDGDRPEPAFEMWAPAPPFRLQVLRGAEIVAERRFAELPRGACELTVHEPAAVSGFVVDAEGRPLAGWCVRAVGEAGPRSDAQHAVATTGEDGSFALAGRAERWQLSVYRQRPWHLGPPAMECAGVPAGSTGLRLVVPSECLPASAIEGRLVGPGGEPLGEAELQLVRTDPRHTRRCRPRGDAPPGTFRFDDLPQGRYELTARVPAHVTRVLAIEVRAAGTVSLGDVAFDPAPELRVRPMHPDGADWPAAPPVPQVCAADGTPLRPWTAPRRDGAEVVFDSLPPGDYVLLPRVYDDLLAEPLPVALRSGAGTRVLWRPAFGRSLELQFAVGGAAEETSLRVSIRDAGGRALPLRQEPRRHDGTWHLRHAFAFGPHVVEAEATGGQRYRLELDVRPDPDLPWSVEVPAVR